MTINALVTPNLPIGTQISLLDTNQGRVAGSIQDVSAAASGIDAFRGTYYVDPLFAGAVKTGSASNPFTTIAAAFAAAAALAITRTIIFLAPGAALVENVTFPVSGDHEIASQVATGVLTTSITGNVVSDSTVASSRRSITAVSIVGNLSGNSSVGTHRMTLTSASISGTTTLTQSGAGVQRLATRGGTSEPASGANILFTFLTGAVVVAGTFWGSYCVFGTSVSVAGTSSFSFCDLPPTTTTTAAADLLLTNCSNTVGGSLGFTAAAGTMHLRPDFATLSELQRVGCILTGTVSLKGLVGASSRNLGVSNIGSAFLSGILPAGLMVCEACLTLLAGTGTATGNATLSVIYTDATGTLVTEAVTTALNVGGAVGSKARGSLPFTQNGATSVNFSVTGITGATGLSYQVDVAIRQAS